ncbi:DUF58 domain-containing protein [Janthinobacterium fluminis]|uniref:DUF58 domain-containing protein n=1 Tax=Janthinobacterium fluminis TaxID=2987524 RepID=A0ABT5JXT7_9BURK|nr:DUF58 domain-containing protein [Janthinobacterium fluminis]MDC8757546.1 DUF58 domain-containing protein [Janthinobacterium fluminis]
MSTHPAPAPPATLTARLRGLAGRWLFQLREREPGEVVLTARRVFIVPTRAGMAFAGLVLLLFIGAINYNLGLGFALTFFSAACAIVDMSMTARNLALLRLAPGRAQPVFAGEVAQFELHLHNRSKLDRFAIWLDFLDAGVPRHVADVGAGASTAVLLSCASGARGWLAAPRVRLVTRFPLGLFKAWSYWQPDARVLVYPAPETAAPPLPLRGAAGGAGGHAGHDDFAGIRHYRPGDPMRHLAWRQIARLDPALGGQLASKHFDAGAPTELTLDFEALPAQLDVEARLARLTRWVLDAERLALPYGLHLDALRLPPALGEAHRAACLRALALHGHVERRP